MKTKEKNKNRNIDALMKRAFADKSLKYDLLDLNRLETAVIYCYSCLESFHADENEYIEKLKKIIERSYLGCSYISDVPASLETLFPKQWKSVQKLSNSITNLSSKLPDAPKVSFNDSPLVESCIIILREIIAVKLKFWEYQMPKDLSKAMIHEIRKQDHIIGSEHLKLHESLLRLVGEAQKETPNLVPEITESLGIISISFEKLKKGFITQVGKDKITISKLEVEFKKMKRELNVLYNMIDKTRYDISLINENMESLLEDMDVEKERETIKLLKKYSSLLVETVLDEQGHFVKDVEVAKQRFEVTYQVYIDDQGIADGGILSKAVTSLEEAVREFSS